ncbi:hypothetical protein C8R44DRAFT_736061 [Mycena epipterygia]|nr:hypothetical protein C8R44DRAFT_736061 [Mycena epipterygia]
MPYYHPYRRLPAPFVSDLATKSLLREASNQLEFYNSIDVMASWNHQQDNWDLLNRPTRLYQHGTGPVGANSFPEVPDFEYPFCPHVDSSLRPFNRMKLYLNKKPATSHRRCDFFKADDHLCHFIVVIPKIRPSKYSCDNDDNSGEEEKAVAQSLSQSSSTSSSSISTSFSSASSSSSSSNAIATLIHPRVSPGVSSPESSPRPQPRPKQPGTTHHSRYSTSIYEARKKAEQSGLYDMHPGQHVAYPKPGVPTHRLLEPYDDLLYPGSLNRTYQELHFFNTKIGDALRALNSTLGVTVIPQPTSPPHRDLSKRVLDPSKQLGNSAEFLDTPIAAALLEWNSRLGVPTDVWAVVSTATTRCSSCRYIRTFHAHTAHLHPITGLCNDLVDIGANA